MLLTLKLEGWGSIPAQNLIFRARIETGKVPVNLHYLTLYQQQKQVM